MIFIIVIVINLIRCFNIQPQIPLQNVFQKLILISGPLSGGITFHRDTNSHIYLNPAPREEN